MLEKEEKTKIITKHATHKDDTGSPEVQIALFTEEIERLSKHLKKHKKDNSSRLGLLKMVARRRRFINLLKKEYPKRYSKIAKQLDLKQ